MLNTQAISNVDFWLDQEVAKEYRDQPLAQDWARTSKVLEEAGEAVQALIGYTGQNPRKGFTHSREQFLSELADVAITAIMGIQHFLKDADATMFLVEERLNYVHRRMHEKQYSYYHKSAKPDLSFRVGRVPE